MWDDFKKFAFKGNIIDLATAVIIGGAFGKIVSSLVNDLIMPVIGIFLGGIDFTNLAFKFGNSVIKYGAFIQTVTDFFIISLTLFFFLRVFLKFKNLEESTPAPPPTITKQELLLTEIRDLIKTKKSSVKTTVGPKITIKKQD